jgi:hypothetical protein
VEECEPCPVFASFILAFTLQLRKKHGKISVRAKKTSARLRKKPQSRQTQHSSVVFGFKTLLTNQQMCHNTLTREGILEDESNTNLRNIGKHLPHSFSVTFQKSGVPASSILGQVPYELRTT